MDIRNYISSFSWMRSNWFLLKESLKNEFCSSIFGRLKQPSEKWFPTRTNARNWLLPSISSINWSQLSSPARQGTTLRSSLWDDFFKWRGKHTTKTNGWNLKNIIFVWADMFQRGCIFSFLFFIFWSVLTFFEGPKHFGFNPFTLTIFNRFSGVWAGVFSWIFFFEKQNQNRLGKIPNHHKSSSGKVVFGKKRWCSCWHVN